MKKQGFIEDHWENENPIPKLVEDVMEVFGRFDGKGAVEIEEELKDLDEYTIGDLRLIGKRLALAPYV